MVGGRWGGAGEWQNRAGVAVQEANRVPNPTDRLGIMMAARGQGTWELGGF